MRNLVQFSPAEQKMKDEEQKMQEGYDRKFNPRYEGGNKSWNNGGVNDDRYELRSDPPNKLTTSLRDTRFSKAKKIKILVESVATPPLTSKSKSHGGN